MDLKAQKEMIYLCSSKLPENVRGYCPISLIEVREYEGKLVPIHPDLQKLKISRDDEIVDPGFLILELSTNCFDPTLNPLSDALFHALGSMFAGCDIPVDIIHIRTSIELPELMRTCGQAYSHIILVGHGGQDGITLLDKNGLSGTEMGELLAPTEDSRPFQLISLCCHTGCEEFAREVASTSKIQCVIAPDGPLEINWVVPFLMQYFLIVFCEFDLSVEDAVNKAILDVKRTPMKYFEGE